MIFDNVVFLRALQIGLLILVYSTIIAIYVGIGRMLTNPECKAKINLLKENYEKQISLKENQIEELAKLVDLTKKRYEEELRQLSTNIEALRTLNDAISENKVILRCAQHPDSNVIMLGGKLRCEEGHFIFRRDLNE